jgi:nitrogen fixation protein NifU and related proteins
MELKELYQEIILDHAKNPRNKGKCDGYNREAKAHNPLCGDKVHIFLKLDKDKNIVGLSFEGEGCAISLASASILTDTLQGKDLSFTKKITSDFLSMLKNKTTITLNSLTEDQVTTITSLSGVQQYPMRIKCATMAWHALLSAIEKKITKHE